jgi:hypothetical protein
MLILNLAVIKNLWSVVMRKSILLFSAFFSVSTLTMPTYGMEPPEEPTLTVRSGREIKELVKQGRARQIHTVEVPLKEHYMDCTFDVSDIASCTNLKKLAIRNIFFFHTPNEEIIYNYVQDQNAQIINKIAKTCPSSLTELEIWRFSSDLSGGANDENLQEFAKRAPGITHLTIDGKCTMFDSTKAITDHAFVNFPHLQSLVLYDTDATYSKNPSIVKRLDFEKECKIAYFKLEEVFDYHVSKGVSQLFHVSKDKVLSESAELVVYGESPNPDSYALIAGWERHTGKRWNGIEHLKKDVNTTFDYLQSRGAAQLKDLSQETRKQIIDKSISMLNFYDKAQPSTTLIMKAYERVTKKKWSRSVHLKPELNRVFDEMAAKRVPLLVNFPQETKKQIIEEAIDFIDYFDLNDPPRIKPDEAICRAWEKIMNEWWYSYL